MTTIRPLERGDLNGVADLVRANLHGWRRDPGVLARNLIDHPWAPAPLRSLVAVDETGALLGSVGAQSRRLRFDGRERDGVCVSHLVVAADRRGGAAGALLVRQLLSGDQDLTWTDSGTPGVVRIWQRFGGDLDHARVCDWMIVLRPGRWMRMVGGEAISPRGWLSRSVAPVRALPMPSRRRSRREVAPPQRGEVTAEEISIAALAAALPEQDRAIRLRVDHDEAYLGYVFAYLDSLGLKDEIVRKLVRRDGRPIGWYAYLARPATSRVIHLGASVREAEAVTSALVDDARGRGAAVLSGRLEPHLHEPLRCRAALIGFSQQPLVHSRNPELLAVMGSSSSLLTEIDLIDSEWW